MIHILEKFTYNRDNYIKNNYIEQLAVKQIVIWYISHYKSNLSNMSPKLPSNPLCTSLPALRMKNFLLTPIVFNAQCSAFLYECSESLSLMW